MKQHLPSRLSALLNAIEEASYDAGLGETTPVGALFDRIAGTSAGAILAAALCVRNPVTGRLNTARELSAIFELCAKNVFAGGWWRRLVTLGGLLGLFGPKDMPHALQERIASEVHDILKEREAKKRLINLGLRTLGTTPAEFRSVLDEERAKWAAIARALDIKPKRQ